jgi:hypothetical protein
MSPGMLVDLRIIADSLIEGGLVLTSRPVSADLPKHDPRMTLTAESLSETRSPVEFEFLWFVGQPKEVQPNVTGESSLPAQ